MAAFRQSSYIRPDRYCLIALNMTTSAIICLRDPCYHAFLVTEMVTPPGNQHRCPKKSLNSQRISCILRKMAFGNAAAHAQAARRRYLKVLYERPKEPDRQNAVH